MLESVITQSIGILPIFDLAGIRPLVLTRPSGPSVT
jgi:hypothetical protein